MNRVIKTIVTAVVVLANVTAPCWAQLAEISHFVSPRYPPLARQAMIAGTVSLRVFVDGTGSVVRVSEGKSAHVLLLEDATANVRNWKFNGGTGERAVSVTFFYGFSGKSKESNPATSVEVDFEGSSIRVFIVTDAFPPNVGDGVVRK